MKSNIDTGKLGVDLRYEQPTIFDSIIDGNIITVRSTKSSNLDEIELYLKERKKLHDKKVII